MSDARSSTGVRMNKWTAAVGSLLGLVLWAASAPASAQAAEVRDISVWNDSFQKGILRVSVTADDPVRRIHATFEDDVTRKIAGGTDDFVLEQQHGNELTYVTRSPVILDPADYYVHVDVTDADGRHHAGESSYAFRYRVIVAAEDVRTDRTSIDFDNREITVSGVLKGTWPGTGEVRPLGGLPVAIWGQYADSDKYITTDEDGSFRRALSLHGSLRHIEVSYPGSVDGPPYTVGELKSLTIGITPQPTRVTAKVDRRSAEHGDPVTITGIAERQGAAGWVPAAINYTSVMVSLCDDEGCDRSFGPIDLEADGTFKLETKAWHDGYYHVQLLDNGGYFEASSARTETIAVQPATSGGAA